MTGKSACSHPALPVGEVHKKELSDFDTNTPKDCLHTTANSKTEILWPYST